MGDIVEFKRPVRKPQRVKDFRIPCSLSTRIPVNKLTANMPSTTDLLSTMGVPDSLTRQRKNSINQIILMIESKVIRYNTKEPNFCNILFLNYDRYTFLCKFYHLVYSDYKNVKELVKDLFNLDHIILDDNINALDKIYVDNLSPEHFPTI